MPRHFMARHLIPALLLASRSAMSFAETSPDASAGSIAPVAVSASGAEASSPAMVIDGSGLREDPRRHGVFTHLSNRWADGGCMWTSKGEPVDTQGRCWLRFDLGRSARVIGLHVWNYNEAGNWHRRSIKSFDLLTSEDGEAWSPAGSFKLRVSAGADDEPGERVDLPRPVKARYLKMVPTAHYGCDHLTGLSEIRVYVSDATAADKVLAPRPPPFKPRYPRTTYSPRRLGRPFPGGENVVWPADAGVIDVSAPPYGATGNGTTDDTAAINRALAEHNDRGAIVYLPNGIYRISDTLMWGKGEKYTALMGQSEKGTVIRLDDKAPGFTDPAKPKPVVWTGGDPAQRFGNEVAHLTIDTGAGNAGCAGVAFVANNQGAIHHVSIDSGSTTVYLPRGMWRIGRTVVIRGGVRRFVGCRGTIDTVGAKGRTEPLLRVADGEGPVDIERLNGPWHDTPVLVSDTDRTVTVRHCGNVSMRFSGGGEVFLDDVVNNPGARFEFKGVTVWAWQFNAEPRGLHVLNDGAKLWVLGIKTESEGTLIQTVGGGATEALGGLCYTSGGSGGVPMFIVEDGGLSVAIAEVCWDDRYYRTIVRETRRGQTRSFTSDDPRWARTVTLFSGQ